MAEYDINIIRPQITAESVKFRGSGFEQARLSRIALGLRTLHTLETMAVNIYRFQITRKESELNRRLIAAMCNEMTHQQDFSVKLYEYKMRPSIIRPAYRLVGIAFGLSSRILGQKMILKTGIWVETKAVSHYAHLLETIDWDEETRKVIEKDQADEIGHINCWRSMLAS